VAAAEIRVYVDGLQALEARLRREMAALLRRQAMREGADAARALRAAADAFLLGPVDQQDVGIPDGGGEQDQG
jgi:hypothetical protein